MDWNLKRTEKIMVKIKACFELTFSEVIMNGEILHMCHLTYTHGAHYKWGICRVHLYIL